MQRNQSLLLKTLTTVLAGTAFNALAQTACDLPFGNFALRLDVGAACGSTATVTVQQFLDRLKSSTPDGLRSVLPAYNTTSIANAPMDW